MTNAIRQSGQPVSSVSIDEFIAAIERLPEDEPRDRGDVWYRTQKEHWLGWLSQYEGPGAYGRRGGDRDAKFAYNHIVNPYMLLWLIEAAGVSNEVAKAAQHAVSAGSTPMQKAGAVRRLVPWDELAKALWREARR